jgi:hypothetical protein
MKFPNIFPINLNNAKLIFATLPKCPSMIYDMNNGKMLTIEYYAIAQCENDSGVRLLSIDDCLNVIGDSYFLDIESAMSELEPDGISTKCWKRISSN